MSTAILSPIHTDLETETNRFISERRMVSNGMYFGLRFLVFLLLACSISFAVFQGWQLGETMPFKVGVSALFVAIEASLVFFAAVVYPQAIRSTACIIAGVGVLVISVATTAGFLLSQQYAQDHKVDEIRKAYVANLQNQASSLSATNIKDRGTIAILNNRIEEGLTALDGVKGSKSTVFFHGLAGTLGVKVGTVQFLFVLFIALTTLSTSVALASYLETLYCESSLIRFMQSHNKRQEVIGALVASKGVIASTPTYTHPQAIQAEPEASQKPKGEGRGGLWEHVYQRVKAKVQNGELNPDVRTIAKEAKGTKHAYSAIERLKQEGVIFQKDNGRYALANGHSHA